MFGWDFPPVKNGGLGVACQGLVRALNRLYTEILFVLPRRQKVDSDASFVFADVEHGQVIPIDSPIRPYVSSQTVVYRIEDGKRQLYAHNLIEEVYNYAERAREIAARYSFDVIHAHDWTSYLAGLAAKEVSGKPLILHVHATSYDQAGRGDVDPEIFEIEREVMGAADSVIAISNYTKKVLVDYHHIDPQKIEVVHNGIEHVSVKELPKALDEFRQKGYKIVLYHGRITIQKGPDYFVRAARRVLDVNPDILFVISGWGDMESQIVQLAADLGIADKLLFAGALWEEDRDRMYQSSDLVVMPSVSEPFGLVPLEALLHGTPVLISRQSGVSEVLTHALQTDFWDVDDMADKILAAMEYFPLHAELKTNGMRQTLGMSWDTAAKKCVKIYEKMSAL